MNTKIILTIATISMLSGCSITSKFKNYEDLNKNERYEIYKENNINENEISLIESNINKEEKPEKTFESDKHNNILKEHKKIEIAKTIELKKFVKAPDLNLKPIVNKTKPIDINPKKEELNEFKMANRVDILSVFEIIDLKNKINSPHLVMLNKKTLNSNHNKFYFNKFKYLDKTTTSLLLGENKITIKRFIEKNKEFFEIRILKTEGNSQYLKKKVYELSMLKNSIIEADLGLYLKIVINE